MSWKATFLIFGLSLFGLVGFAQENESEEEGSHVPKIRAVIMMANSHVPNAFEGEKRVAIIPAWGLDVDYYFHSKWSVAFQADMKVQSFEVEKEGVFLERSYPFSGAFVLHYHTKKHWSFYAGPGYEFEKSENLGFFRIGTEYSFEITEQFEIALNLAYENKQDIYNAWTFGIAFNKLLWERKD
ncbi:hypothetical protein [Algoriphagus formosus]|uniref:DUF3575 domain-containing protein n=1 Tax=Algoriphagus formosus TaxID=2007308 RepID=A0A4R5V107_9BACT|nr:hypothetical protein [Algoriphagus aquimaris]TDK45423.1 hypothetical protein E1898_07990 [Algoriphagus aquimaris]